MSNGYPMLYPGMYSPGQIAFNNNPELSQLITMFSGPLLGAMAGPGNFIPHMMPGQALMDQFAMRNYQNQTRTAAMNLAGGQNNVDVANRLLGVRSAFTGEAATDMNREQAMQFAGMLNNPVTKTFMGMMMGPENMEALLHGTRGDVQTLGNTMGRIGYFRKSPTGNSRMDAQSIEDLTTGVFSHLYEPQGDVDQLATDARAGGAGGLAATKKLQQAAGMEDRRVVDDAELQTRLQQKGDTKVEQLYQKYVQGGTETDPAKQAAALTKFDRAVKEARVLDTQETTVGQMRDEAFKRPTNEMHGLMAGQVSQLAENLFQRGVLPPSVGNLDAKGRVGAIAETKLDDATLTRLAETMARRDLQGKNAVGPSGKKFSDMTSQEQIDEVKRASGTFKTEIEKTQKEAEDVAAGTSTKSAEDVLQMTGGEALSGNVDANRTAARLKEYTESIAAVRDIFGDNGNSNAPMPALMAVLDQLTQGSMGAMNPAKAATTLRQMQTMARETGTGMQQLAAMSSVAGAMGQQLGIAPAITMQNVAMSMGMTKSAMDRGAFSSQTPGAMTKEQFQQEAITRLQHGDASDNAKAMAALNRIYQVDPDRFKGTELEAAMAAYQDRSSGGDYEYDPTPDKPNSGDEIKANLFESIGKGGQHEAIRLLQEGGASDAEFYNVAYDPRTATEEFMTSGAGFMTQKHRIVQELSNLTAGGMLNNALQGTAVEQDLGDFGMRHAGDALTEMVLDSSGMNVSDQISFLQKNMPAKLAEHLQRTQNLSEDDAKTMAGEIIGQTFGYDSKGNIDRSRLNMLVGNFGTAANDQYGKNAVMLNQLYGNGGDAKAMQEMVIAEERAKASKRLVGVGNESTPMGRVSDYFMDIGKRGEKFNIGSLIKEMAPYVSDKEVLQQYAGATGAGLHTLSDMRDKVEVTQESVDDLAAKGDTAALKKLAGIKDADYELVDDTKLKDAREAKLKGMDTKAVDAAYQRFFGNTGANISEQKRREKLAQNAAFIAESDQEYLTAQHVETGKKHINTDQLKAMAMRSVGQALEGMDASGRSYAGMQEDIESVQRAVFHGDDEVAKGEGIEAVGRLFKDAGGVAGKLAGDDKAMKELMATKGEAGKKAILEQLGFKTEEEQAKFEADKSLKSADKTAEQRLAEVMTAVQSAGDHRLDAVSDEKTAQAAMRQRADKVDLQATNVYVNGAQAAAAAAAVPPQKPGSPISDNLETIDAELQSINAKEGNWLWDRITPEDKQRREELIKQREAVAAADKAAGVDKDKKDQPAATTTATDKPLQPAKTADKDAATAADIQQQNADAAARAAGVPTFDELSAAEQEEVEHYEHYREQKELHDKMNDPNATEAERAQAARDYKANKEDDKDLYSPEMLAAARIAEARGLDPSGGNLLEQSFGGPNSGKIKVHGVEVSPEEFYSQLEKVKEQGPLSERSRAYIESQQKSNVDAAAGETLPQEKTAGTPDATKKTDAAKVEAAANAGVQQVTMSANIPVGGGEGGNLSSLTLNGSLRLDGLHEAILAATADKAVPTPSGPPIVKTGQMGRGGLPSGKT